MKRYWDWKLSPVSALEDVGNGGYLLVSKATITESMIFKRIDKRLALKVKAGVYGVGIEDDRDGIWILKFNREPSEEKILDAETIEW